MSSADPTLHHDASAARSDVPAPVFRPGGGADGDSAHWCFVLAMVGLAVAAVLAVYWSSAAAAVTVWAEYAIWGHMLRR